jgi:small subunit ribosomal protein S19
MRSSKKYVYIPFFLLKKVLMFISGESKKQINTYSRRATIVPEMVGLSVGVYNGQKFIPVFITESMVGHKLGEFSLTRKYPLRKTDSAKSKAVKKKK